MQCFPLNLMRFKPKRHDLDGFQRCFRMSFSLSGSLYGARRPWTSEESRKLLELYEKGLSVPQISKEFGDRSIISVRDHVADLRRGSSEISSKKPWTAEEISILLAKRQAGCAFKDIHLPGRSRMALQERWKHCQDLGNRWQDNKGAKAPPTVKSRRTYTDAEVERIIDLRLKERKSMKEIAFEMGRSNESIIQIWGKRCKHLVTKEALQELRSSGAWTSKNDDLLVKLYNQGKKVRDIHTHFPDRTLAATQLRLYALRNSLLARQANASPATMESLKLELEPYLEAPLTTADLKRVRERFPAVSGTAVQATLWRMRHGKAIPKRRPLERMEAEERMASRRSSRAV
jgi:hypothetical protein